MDDHASPKGYLLKEAREARGISLETIHEETKIPMDALKAIEEGYTIRTLSSFYLKGFIKMYAQYLGVDIKEIIDTSKPAKLPDPVKSATPPLDDVLKERFQTFLSKQKKKELFRGLAVLVVLLVVLKLGSMLIHRLRAPNPKKAGKVEAVKPAAPAEVKPQRTNPPPKAQSQPAQIVTPAKDSADEKKNIALSVRARKDSWLRVESDGNVVFQAVLKEWTTETWRANQQIEISGKNISQLEFELNGKLIGALGRDDRQAKKVIITKNGLSVEK